MKLYMRILSSVLLAGGALAANVGQVTDPGNLRLHYDAPDSDRESGGLPIGNG